jgi:hypothetical protein
MSDSTKVTNGDGPAQAESPKAARAVQIEKALLWREVQRIRDQIAPHMIAIVKVFTDKLGIESSDKVGRAIGRTIGCGLASHASFDEESIFGARHLKEQFCADDVERIVSRLVEAFLTRVDEIGEIAEDAQARAGQVD